MWPVAQEALPLTLPAGSAGRDGGGAGSNGNSASISERGAAALLGRLAAARAEEESTDSGAGAVAADVYAGEIFLEVEISEVAEGEPSEAGAGLQGAASPESPPNESYEEFVTRLSLVPPLIWANRGGGVKGESLPWADRPEETGKAAECKVTPAQSPSGGAYVVGESSASSPAELCDDQHDVDKAAAQEGGGPDGAAPSADSLISSIGDFISRYR